MENENLYTFENPEYRKTYWHTSSHIMAQAVKRLWPEVQLAIGPAIEEGGWRMELTGAVGGATDAPDQQGGIPVILQQMHHIRGNVPREEIHNEQIHLLALQCLNHPLRIRKAHDLVTAHQVTFHFTYLLPQLSGHIVQIVLGILLFTQMEHYHIDLLHIFHCYSSC